MFLAEKKKELKIAVRVLLWIIYSVWQTENTHHIHTSTSHMKRKSQNAVARVVLMKILYCKAWSGIYHFEMLFFFYNVKLINTKRKKKTQKKQKEK